MTSFDYAYNIVIANEGGYSNLSKDPGGETYKGISRVFNPGWKGWAIIDAYKSRMGKIPYNTVFNNPALDTLIKEFYRVNYWDRIKGDQFNNPVLAANIFDWAVHSNYGAIKGVNRALSKKIAIPITSSITADTLSVANAYPKLSNNLVVYERADFYRSLVKANKSLSGFLSGWLTRANKFFHLSN